MQKRTSVLDVYNANSERPEETNLAAFNDFHLEYNEATNILTFQEISSATIAGGATNVPMFNSRFFHQLLDLKPIVTTTSHAMATDIGI